jgi:hypothetical protein
MVYAAILALYLLFNNNQEVSAFSSVNRRFDDVVTTSTTTSSQSPRYHTNNICSSSRTIIADQRTQTPLYADVKTGAADTAADTAAAENKNEEDETETEIPIDQARTTTEFLAGLWKLIAKGNDMVRGVSAYYAYAYDLFD